MRKQRYMGLTDERGTPLGRSVCAQIDRFLEEPNPDNWMRVNNLVLNDSGQTFSDCVMRVRPDFPMEKQVYSFVTKNLLTCPRNPDVVTAMRALNCAKAEAKRPYFA